MEGQEIRHCILLLKNFQIEIKVSEERTFRICSHKMGLINNPYFSEFLEIVKNYA